MRSPWRSPMRIMGDRAEDDAWMRQAIELAVAEKGSDPANTPIAALVVLDGRLIASGVNRTAERHDATAHAEVEAIRAAGAALGDMDLRRATLYSTLQPCGMCTMASIWASIGRIVYGAGRDDVHQMYFEDRHLDTLDFIADAYTDDLTISGGVQAAACAALYYGPDDDVPESQQANK
jgi:tRNA(adenine34) deaminase